MMKKVRFKATYRQVKFVFYVSRGSGRNMNFSIVNALAVFSPTKV